MSTCREQVTRSASTAEENACLLFKVAGANTIERVFATPMNWKDGWFTLISGTQLPVRQGQTIEAEAFVFADGQIAPACDAEALAFGTVCDPEAAWCLLKLKQPQVVVSEEGVTIDFDDGSGQCEVSGQLTNQTEIEACDGADNDCDGMIDETVRSANGRVRIRRVGYLQTRTKCVCVEGVIICRATLAPQAELLCDNIDNDCGNTDEVFPTEGDACETDGAGLCRPGTRICTAGTIECQPTVMPNEFEEICDGLDNGVTALLTKYFQNKVRTVTQVFSVFVRPAGSFVPTVT